MNCLKPLILACILSPIFFATACANTPISQEQKQADIDSLKAFEAANGPPTLVADQPKQKVPEFVCKNDVQINCDQQRVLHNSKHRQQPVFITQGKYKVDLFFVNDGSYPDRSIEKDNFESVSKNDETYVLDQIFERYLGNDFDSYSPTILNVNQSTVGISILVGSSNELDVFLDDPKVVGIYHIGNNRVVPEGY